MVGKVYGSANTERRIEAKGLTPYLCAQQIAQRPNQLSDSAFHRGSATDRTVNAAEIVVREVQCERRFQVFPFLREAISQARESTHCHSDIQILIMSANSPRIAPSYQ